MVQIPNIFASGMSAFDDQTQRLNAFAQQRASRDAGAAIAGGDYQGGSDVLNRAGMLPQAHNVLADQQVLEDRKAASDQAVVDRAQKAKQIQIEGLSKITDALQAVPEGQRAPWLQQHVPLIQQLGVPTDAFAHMTEDQLTNAALVPWKNLLGKAQADFTLGEGQKRFSGTTNTEIASGPPKPQEYLVLPEGGKAIPKPTNGATVSNGAPAPAPAAAAAQDVDAAIGATGATVTSGLRTPEHNAAVGGVPNSYHLTDHARDLVPPPGATIAELAAEMRRRLPGSKVIEEKDHVHVQWGGPQATAATAQPGDPAGTLYGNPKPVQWVSDGKGNLVNQVTGDRKIDPTASADIAADPKLVKAIIEGRAPMPTANRAATDPKWQAAMAEAMAQDPTLDGANYATRVKTRADFATGTAAKTKTALNTALGHAGDLDSQVDALHNSPFRMLNATGNLFATETGDPRVKTFNLTKEALLHEAMKVFAGSAGSLQEFSQLSENLTVNDSPAQQHSVIRKLVGLLASKMDALGEQYKTGMGTELDQSQIMSPHAQQVFAKISGLPGGSTSTAAPPVANGGWGKVVTH